VGGRGNYTFPFVLDLTDVRGKEKDCGSARTWHAKDAGEGSVIVLWGEDSGIVVSQDWRFWLARLGEMIPADGSPQSREPRHRAGCVLAVRRKRPRDTRPRSKMNKVYSWHKQKTAFPGKEREATKGNAGKVFIRYGCGSLIHGSVAAI
jgi:hypothetical protein